MVGTLADKFGRKIMVYIFGFFVALFSLLSGFANVYWLFALFRFIVGFSIGMYPCDTQLLCRGVVVLCFKAIGLICVSWSRIQLI